MPKQNQQPDSFLHAEEESSEPPDQPHSPSSRAKTELTRPQSRDLKVYAWVKYVLTALITALVVGGGMWWWMNGRMEVQRQELEQKVTELTEQVQEIDESSATDTKDVSTAVPSTLNTEQGKQDQGQITANPVLEQEKSTPQDRIYRSDKYGISFLYPSEWYSHFYSIYRDSVVEKRLFLKSEIVPDVFSTSLQALGDQIWFTVEKMVNDDGQPIPRSTWLTEEGIEEYNVYTPINIQWSKIGQYDSVSVISNAGAGRDQNYYIFRDSLIYHFHWYPYSGTNDLNKFLSTIQFIDVAL